MTYTLVLYALLCVQAAQAFKFSREHDERVTIALTFTTWIISTTFMNNGFAIALLGLVTQMTYIAYAPRIYSPIQWLAMTSWRMASCPKSQSI